MWSSSKGAYYLLSPVLFSIYIDSIIERLRMSGYGCLIGGEFFGCIMYAECKWSRISISYYSVCVLQKMIDICVDELNCIGLSFNAKKSCLLRFEPRYIMRCLWTNYIVRQ